MELQKAPQQNGVTKLMNGTQLERACCMVSNAGLMKDFWVRVVNTCYLVIRSPSTAIDELKTPFEVWSGTGYSDLRIFGCLAYAHTSEGKA